jgi:hypothetical protein
MLLTVTALTGYAEKLAELERQGDEIVVQQWKDDMAKLDKTVSSFEELQAASLGEVLAGAAIGEPRPDILDNLANGAKALTSAHSKAVADSKLAQIERIAVRAGNRGEVTLRDSLLRQLDSARLKGAAVESLAEDAARGDYSVLQAQIADFTAYALIHGAAPIRKRINEDRLEDFLTGTSRSTLNKIRAGRSGHNGIFSTTKQRLIANTLARLDDGRTFDVRKPLREGCARYPTDATLALLNAYVLLIEEGNTVSQEDAYDYLRKTYDVLETEAIAYNLIRVGTRLNRLDRQLLTDLVDHARHSGDGVSDLAELAIYALIKDSDYEGGLAIYHKLSKSQRADILPSLRLTILVASGEFERAPLEGADPANSTLIERYLADQSSQTANR